MTMTITNTTLAAGAALTLLCGCNILKSVGVDPCDPTSPLHNGLSAAQDAACDYCGLTECDEDGGTGDGPFACVAPPGERYDVCIQAGAPYTDTTSYTIDAWKNAGLSVAYKWCNHAATYPGMMMHLPSGMTMFICSRQGEMQYKDASGDGSIMLVPGTQPNPPFVGSIYTESDTLPVAWSDVNMTDVNRDVYSRGILCGDGGFTCAGSNYGCACLCDSDPDCENGFGHGVESWVCEGGHCLSEWTGEAIGGPTAYGFARWEDGVTVEGSRVSVTPEFAVAATIDGGLARDSHSFDLLTGEIMACRDDSLCAYIGLDVGDIVDVDALGLAREMEAGEPLTAAVVRASGDTEQWSMVIE